MFNTNSFYLNLFQSYFQAPRRRRFQTNRFNKAERLDNTRVEQYGQEANEFESREQTSFNPQLNSEASLEDDSTQWAKVGRRQPSGAKPWSRSFRSIGLDRDTIELKSTGSPDFIKSGKASKSLGKGFEKPDNQEQRDPFKSNVLMHNKTNGIEAFFGRLSPIILPKGMSPVLRPSIKTASPTITAASPIHKDTA